ncbi:MAG: IS66 family transposase, partial [Bryobacteraceae bacterium]
MPQAPSTKLQSDSEMASFSVPQFIALVQSLTATIQSLEHRLEWFERQLFGTKSERLCVLENDQQLCLGEVVAPPPSLAPAKEREIPAHKRRVPQRDAAKDAEAESVPFFDEGRVPVERIELTAPELEGAEAGQFEVIGQKITHRLAQRPGSYVILKYVRPVTKRRDTGTISCPPAPVGVIEGSRADVSFLAGLLVDKFSFHLPLYRQHQRLEAAGIRVSRPWLTQLTQGTIGLLEPIYDAQFASIRASRVKAMDETPIKAGRKERGKMRTAYFWPVYGEHNEVCFPYFPSRKGANVYAALGAQHDPGAVLLTDGYAAYASYAKKVGITHALCWAHARREIFEAESSDPEGVREGLRRVAALYALEEEIRDQKLTGEAKRVHRLTHSKPHVEAFFAWVNLRFEQHGLRPATPFIHALEYARERRLGLEVFLTDPDVALDTNHLERALRVVPMGRKNWNFCWTELGAKHVGIVQSLIVTCRLHGIDPYTYFVDVLQRVGEHPASHVAGLTPRLWKQCFAANPLRSALH